MRSLPYILAPLMLLSGCELFEPAGHRASVRLSEDTVLLVEPGDLADLPAHPLVVSAATLDREHLVLDIAYSGGCKTHLLGLVGLRALEKSDPPNGYLRLVHDGNGDPCDAFITRTLRFDLRPLLDVYRADGLTGEVRLKIHAPGGDVPAFTLPIHLS